MEPNGGAPGRHTWHADSTVSPVHDVRPDVNGTNAASARAPGGRGKSEVPPKFAERVVFFGYAN
jgi:hypothetical protein